MGMRPSTEIVIYDCVSQGARLCTPYVTVMFNYMRLKRQPCLLAPTVGPGPLALTTAVAQLIQEVN